MKWVYLLARFFRRFLYLNGMLFLSLLALALSNLPWDWYRWMALPGKNEAETPGFIVMMGGGGIPSESGLTRSWKAAEAAHLYSNAVVIVAMPLEDNESPVLGIEHELRIRGVSADRIQREFRGRNTREQALEVYKLLAKSGQPDTNTIALVTSPEHMRRTWRSFERAGFNRLMAIPSWPEAITADLRYEESEMGDRALGGAVGASITVRYRFWDNLGILVKCARESAALMYYRLLGWI